MSKPGHLAKGWGSSPSAGVTGSIFLALLRGQYGFDLCVLQPILSYISTRSLRGVVANVLDCDIVVSEFEPQSTGAASLQKDKTPHTHTHAKEFPIYDTKKSDGEASVILDFVGMQSTPSLPSLPGPLWPGVVAPDRILAVGKKNCLTFKRSANK